MKKTITDVHVENKRVFVRADFNVPLDENCHITDDTRIQKTLPTIKYLLDHKGAMENKLYVLPEELNTEIAALKLQAMGAGIDTLSDEQKAYLAAE